MIIGENLARQKKTTSRHSSSSLLWITQSNNDTAHGILHIIPKYTFVNDSP